MGNSFLHPYKVYIPQQLLQLGYRLLPALSSNAEACAVFLLLYEELGSGPRFSVGVFHELRNDIIGHSHPTYDI